MQKRRLLSWLGPQRQCVVSEVVVEVDQSGDTSELPTSMIAAVLEPAGPGWEPLVTATMIPSSLIQTLPVKTTVSFGATAGSEARGTSRPPMAHIVKRRNSR
jgi:hypothetical protein